MAALFIIGLLAFLACTILMLVNIVKKKPYKRWGLGMIISFVIFIIGISGMGSNEPSTLTIDSNLDVDKLSPGMVCGRDFKIDDDYFSTSVKMMPLSRPDIYTADPENIESPYFVWVCYPQITKSSQTRIIMLEDNGSGVANSEFTVLEIAKMDTVQALDIYGGTKGTKANGW